MFTFGNHNIVGNSDMKTAAIKSFEDVTQFEFARSNKHEIISGE